MTTLQLRSVAQWQEGVDPARRICGKGAGNAAELRWMRGLTFEHAALFLERWNEYFGR